MIRKQEKVCFIVSKATCGSFESLRLCKCFEEDLRIEEDANERESRGGRERERERDRIVKHRLPVSIMKWMPWGVR